MELPNRPFLTTVVGSLPKPPWLQEKLPLNSSGKQVHGKGATWLFEGELLKTGAGRCCSGRDPRPD